MTELYKFKDRAQYTKALDSILPESYVQKRSIPSGEHKYYPAAIKEAVADDIFQYWNVIDEKYMLLVNELVCTVKIVFCPSYPGSDELFCTGSAATPVQMDSGSSISSFPNNKKTNALEYNLPNVRTEAISKALETLGNIFGRNLNRKLNKTQFLPDDFTIRKHVEEKSKQKPINEKTEKPIEKEHEKPEDKIDIPF